MLLGFMPQRPHVFFVRKAATDRDIEEHKARLKTESDREIESLRVLLKKDTFEHEVRFRKLHEKVADVLAEVYTHLAKCYASVGNYVSILDRPNEPKEEKLKVVTQAGQDFVESVNKNQLFMPKEIRDTLGEFNQLL